MLIAKIVQVHNSTFYSFCLFFYYYYHHSCDYVEGHIESEITDEVSAILADSKQNDTKLKKNLIDKGPFWILLQVGIDSDTLKEKRKKLGSAEIESALLKYLEKKQGKIQFESLISEASEKICIRMQGNNLYESFYPLWEQIRDGHIKAKRIRMSDLKAIFEDNQSQIVDLYKKHWDTKDCGSVKKRRHTLKKIRESARVSVLNQVVLYESNSENKADNEYTSLEIE